MNADSIIKVRCPFCSKVLMVKDSPANAGKKLKCPACGKVHPFESFKKIEQQPVEVATEVSGLSVEESYALLDKKTGREYQLPEGKNLVGRMTYQQAPKATVPVYTEDMGVSRAHFYLEVMRAVDGRLHCYISNASNKNPTYIAGEQLKDGDRIAVCEGDIIKTSDSAFSLIRHTQTRIAQQSSAQDEWATEI